MQAFTLFTQNFAVAESLLQLYNLFHGLQKKDLHDDLRLAICTFWGTSETTTIRPTVNDRVMLLARASTPVPESLTIESGLDFLLRETVVVACTALEAFFWDVLREYVLTVVKARRTGADESLRNLTFTLGDYISIQQYDDPDLRLKQIILKNFERGTLYDANSIEKVAQTLTVKNFWEQIEKISVVPASELRRFIGELIHRRNQIAHRADRPDEGEEMDAQELRPISLAWTNQRVQTAKTLVTASADLFRKVIKRLEDDIRVAEEQAEARRLAKLV